MQLLYAKAAARNNQCRFVEFPTGMHMDTWLAGGDHYWRTIQQFLEQHAPEKKEDRSSQNESGMFFFPAVFQNWDGLRKWDSFYFMNCMHFIQFCIFRCKFLFL